jgi:urease accessory protein
MGWVWTLSWRGCAGRLSPSCSRLRFERQQQHTALIECHIELPLALQRPLRGPSGQAVVTLLTPGGALFDGDDVRLSVECGAEADVTLTTASASRLNRCDHGESAFRLDASVASGAVLRYVPCELIPFRGARYRQVLDIRLDGDAGAVLLEVIGAGMSDDPFGYARLEFLTRIRLGGEDVVREHFVLAERARDSLDGFTHYAGMLVLGVAPEAADATRLLTTAGVRGAASALAVDGLALKAVGHAALPLREALLDASCCPGWLRPLLPQ